MSEKAPDHSALLPHSESGESFTLQNGTLYDAAGRVMGRSVQIEKSIDIAISQAEQQARLKLLRGTMRKLAHAAIADWNSFQDYVTESRMHHLELYTWLGEEINTLTMKSRSLSHSGSRKEVAQNNLLRSHYVGQRTELIIPALYMQPLFQHATQAPMSLYVPATEAADNLPIDTDGVRQAYDATILQFNPVESHDSQPTYDFSRVQVKTGRNRGKRYAAHIALLEFTQLLPQRSEYDSRANLDYVIHNLVANTTNLSKGDSGYLSKIRQAIERTVAQHIKNESEKTKNKPAISGLPSTSSGTAGGT